VADLTKYVLISLAVFQLVACTPQSVIDTGVDAARSVRVLNNFEITRLKSHGLYFDSHICLGINKVEGVDSMLILQTAQNNLSPYFSTVDQLPVMMSLNAAQQKGKASCGGQFLFYLGLQEAKESLKVNIDELVNDDIQDIEEQEEVAPNYSKLKLEITIIDLNNGTVFDKIQLTARDNWLPFYNKKLDDLLKQPFKVIGAELTGIEPS